MVMGMNVGWDICFFWICREYDGLICGVFWCTLGGVVFIILLRYLLSTHTHHDNQQIVVCMCLF